MRGIVATLCHHQQLKFGAMVQQPVQMEQARIDHVFIAVPLVLDDYRAVVLIETKRIDTPTMRRGTVRTCAPGKFQLPCRR